MESFFRIELSLSWGCRGGGLIGFTLVPYDRHGPGRLQAHKIPHQLYASELKRLGWETYLAVRCWGKLIRFPRQKSMKRLREAIRALTKRTSGICLRATIHRINRTMRGWYNYFSESIPNTFDEVDGFVRRRLRAILLKRYRTPRFGTGNAHLKWPNKFFEAQGLFSTSAACVASSCSAQR